MYKYFDYTNAYEELTKSKSIQNFLKKYPNENVLLWEKTFFDGSYIQLFLDTNKSIFYIKTESINKDFESLLDAHYFFLEYCKVNLLSKFL